MKLYRIHLLLLFISLFPAGSNAQLFNHGNNEFYLGDGLLSYDQFAGIFGQQTNATGIMSFPNNITGAAFLTYRHSFSKTRAFGLTLGFDNQTGDLSYGKEGVMGYMGNNGYGPSGSYKREVYTVAAEILENYRSEYKFKVYGYAGVGYTSSKITFNFLDNINAQNYFYGTPSSLFLHKNTTVDFSHFNAQLTPLGLSTGEVVSCFIEVGFGYKGIINGGISYRFGKQSAYSTPAQSEPDNGTIQGIVILPLDFPVDSSLKDLGEVRTGKPGHHADYKLSEQIENLSRLTKDKNGNAVLIKEILPPGRYNMFGIRAEAYYTVNTDALRLKIRREKDKVFQNENCAYLVVYRPKTIKKLPGISLDINDSNNLLIDPGVTYTFKIKQEGVIRIATEGFKMSLNTKYGNYYYIRVANKKIYPRLKLVGNDEGELEAGMTSKTKFYDIERDSLLSTTVNSRKPLAVPVAKNSKIVIIPGRYPVDDNWEYKGKLNSGKPGDGQDLGLAYRLNKISDNAVKDSANVLKIVQVKKLNGNDCYYIIARAWHAKNPDSIRAVVENENNNEVGNKNYTYIVIYRPDDITPILKGKKCRISINDTNKLIIASHIKYIFRIQNEGNVKVSVFKSKALNINAKKGNVYYIKAKPLKRTCDIEEVENGYGEIESSTLADVQIVDL